MKLTLLLSVALVMGFGAESSVKMKDLPAAVQKTVQEQTKGATIKGMSKEVEKGVTQYEVETTVNGKSRDLLIDASGALISVEEPTTLDAVPAAAKAALEKAATGGKIKSVETVTKGSVVSYEAVIQKGMKKTEVAVSADGTLQK